MKLTSFVPRDISLSDDFVGFPLIHQDLSDIVKYLDHLKRITQEGKDDYKRMLIAAESGALFLGRTGAGKTHALHCVVNEAIKLDYNAVDGSLMLGKTVIEPIDVREFFDSCKVMAEEKPLLIVYDDARQLLGSRHQGPHSQDGNNNQETRPMLSEFRRQIDGLQYYDNPAYIIVTSATRIWHIARARTCVDYDLAAEVGLGPLVDTIKVRSASGKKPETHVLARALIASIISYIIGKGFRDLSFGEE